MRIGRLQLNWNKPPAKVERELELEKFYTFKCGTPIYTYAISDLGRISGKYLDGVKNTLNFMIQYSAGPEQVKAWAKNVNDLAKNALDNKMDRTAALAKIMEYAQQLPKLQDYVEDLNKKQWLDLYVMFFVLPEERECYFSPKWNARKIALLEQEPDDVQEVFFSFLDNVTTYLSSTYRQDLLASTIQERDLATLAASLTVQMQKLNTPSPSADGQASASKATAK